MATLRCASVLLCILVYTSAQNANMAHPQFEPNLLSNFLERITDVCACVNVPSDVNQMDRWSMNSHGKDLLAYFEPNCMQKKRLAWYIIGGHYKNMIDLSELKQLGQIEQQIKYKILSIGPDPNSEMFKTNCIKNTNIAIMGLEMFETDGKLAKQLNAITTGMLSDPNSIQLLRQFNNRIHFFAQPHFQDFIVASEVTFDCSNIFPKTFSVKLSEVRSIRTSECVMLFSEPNCLGRSTRIQSPGTNELDTNWESTISGSKTLSLLYKTFPNWIWTTNSFYSCNTHYANQGLNVEITEFNINSNSPLKPKVLYTHKNVCTCDNVPKYVRNLERWSLNNHDTSMLVYFEENCHSNLFDPLWIPAGLSSYSMGMGTFRQINELTNGLSRILSFGPDYNSHYFKTNCIKFYSTIVKFEITEQNYTEQNEEMKDSEKVFRNDGPKELTRTFTASEIVRDSFSVEIGTSLQTMQKVELDKSFNVETKQAENQSESNSQRASIGAAFSASVGGPWKFLGVNLSGSISGGISNAHSRASYKSHEAVIREGLRRAYQNESVVDNSKNIATVVESTRSETVSEVITVPACSVQVVHAYVKTVKNKQIKYKALVKVSGSLGTGNMTAREVSKFMDDRMQYVGIYDENTILAYSTTGYIKVEYGVTALFSTKVLPISECMERYHLSSSSACTKPNLLIMCLVLLHTFVYFM